MEENMLILPEELLVEIGKAAAARNIGPTEMMRKFLKLGFLLADIEKDPDASLIYRVKGKPDREVTF